MAKAQRADNLEFHTDMPIGDILRRTREHYKQSLQKVEKTLRIRASQLEALEQGNIEALPGKVYAIGFVRTYSEYLGLDADQMVRLFKTQSEGRAVDPALHFPTPASETRIAPVWLAGASTVLALFIGGIWMSAKGKDSASSYIPAIETAAGPSMEEVYDPLAPSQGHSQEDLQKVAAVDVAPKTEISSAPAARDPMHDGIVLNITGDSWVEIRDQKGKVILSRVLKKGDQYFVPDRPDLSMSLGNAGGVEILIGDTVYPPLGARGLVRKDIPLDLAALQKQLTTPQE